ncbi:MAG: hypothetical protein LBT94_04090 [Prevotellaceae bacterium]|jgi:hypothetical protein|nr:hypothetical protein [Prevotellaceae bacterium]
MTIIQLKVHNQFALDLLHELETLGTVRILNEAKPAKTGKMSEILRNAFSKEAAESFRKHVQEMRSEWG